MQLLIFKVNVFFKALDSQRTKKQFCSTRIQCWLNPSKVNPCKIHGFVGPSKRDEQHTAENVAINGEQGIAFNKRRDIITNSTRKSVN